MLIDTHLHLLDCDNDIDSIINDAFNNDVKYLIVAGTNVEDNIKNLEVFNDYENVFLTLGYHPEVVNEINDLDLLKLEQNIIDNREKVVGIGEIGLDYHYTKENKQEQIDLFEKQLFIAKKYNLPVVVHSRDAINDTYEIIKNMNIKKGIIHCFSGSYEMAKKFIDLGFYLGVGGVITFKNSNLKEVIKKLDLKNIVFETDSPYLSPYRGEKNEPKNVLYIANFVKDLYGCSLDCVENTTTDNVIKLFDLNI